MLNPQLALIAGAMLTAACVWNNTSGQDDLGQGWSQTDRDIWYEQTQGSRLIPYSWAKALEVASGTEKFFGDANMARFGYLPPEASSKSKLPVGFAIDDQKEGDERLVKSKLRWYSWQEDKEPWVGMNCAACHTAELLIPKFEGAAAPADLDRLRIDGGPTIADFQLFIEAFDAALHATHDDPPKFERFANNVLPSPNDQNYQRNPGWREADKAKLKSALKSLFQWQDQVALANRGGMPQRQEPQFGSGRLDAFGHIFNKVALFVGAEDQRFNPSTAPTSYPFVWNTSQSDKIQWNGIASNAKVRLVPGGHPFDYGALGRNSGEVTGVFGDIVLTRGAGLGGYNSSIQVERLSELERILARLRPPSWPATLGKIKTDPGTRWARGRDLFDKQCESCHERISPTELNRSFKANMNLFRAGVPDNIPPGTDIWMACNAYTYQIKTGVLEGTRRSLILGEKLGPVEPTARVLETVVKGEMAHKKKDVVNAFAKAIFNSRPAPRPEPPAGAFIDPELERARRQQICMTEKSDFLGYKSRPLTGIWATAPYLHNGSVPTLYDLLLEPAKRPKVFYVGTRRFDPNKVGYVTAQAADNRFRFNTHDAGGRPIPGNSNEGHDYNNRGLTEDDRWALVEYMKTL